MGTSVRGWFVLSVSVSGFIILMTLTALLDGCGTTVSGENSGYPDEGRPNYTSYGFNLTYITDAGVLVDDPRNELNLGQLDSTIANVEACLAKFVATPLTETEQKGGWCFGTAGFVVKPGLRVKIPSDWNVSACTAKEVFPCSVPVASCQAKGQNPEAVCPCSCRAIIQDNAMIVTAPNLELFPAMLVELVTGCAQIWTGGRLQECGMPSLVAN